MEFPAPLPPWQKDFVTAAAAAPVSAAIVTGGDGSGMGELALALAHAFCGTAASAVNPDLLITLPENKIISVDAAREVIDFLSYAPVTRPRRVAVLLRADCMNPAAANALLKTLEEPHPQKSLVLWTQTLRQLPPTIISRCHVYHEPAHEEENAAAEMAFYRAAPLAVEQYPPNWHKTLAAHFSDGARMNVSRAISDLSVTLSEKTSWQKGLDAYLQIGCRLNPHCLQWEEKIGSGEHHWLEGLLKWTTDGARVAAALPPQFFPASQGVLQKLAANKTLQWLDFYRYLLTRRALAAHSLARDLFMREILNAYQQLCAR